MSMPGLQIIVRNGISQPKDHIYVVGTQKNHHDEKVFEHPKHMFKLIDIEINTFYAQKFPSRDLHAVRIITYAFVRISK